MSDAPDKTERRGPTLGFSEFILSIGTNALEFLGHKDDDMVPSAADLAQAAQFIDIIAMLKEKTAGNLDAEEQNLIDALLYDLRMKYLEVANAQ
ncbi:MAG: DUF1844 domain-containing protein [Deltaproteobacteria bacterium]